LVNCSHRADAQHFQDASSSDRHASAAQAFRASVDRLSAHRENHAALSAEVAVPGGATCHCCAGNPYYASAEYSASRL